MLYAGAINCTMLKVIVGLLPASLPPTAQPEFEKLRLPTAPAETVIMKLFDTVMMSGDSLIGALEAVLLPPGKNMLELLLLETLKLTGTLVVLPRKPEPASVQ